LQAIIIGAGRGRRLKALTNTQPKCFASVGGQRILDWTLGAFESVTLLDNKPPVFIGGYRIEDIRDAYPHLTFCHNADWPNNNILASLFHAEHHMEEGFICAYSDILFCDSIVRRSLDHPADIVLCVDTHWRDRYAERTMHPEDDAEKVLAEGDRVIRIHREITARETQGEYIGVARFSAKGARVIREHYHRVRKAFAGRPWRGAEVFEKAYLIHLFQEMIEQEVDIRMVMTKGDYMEIDTDEDFSLANRDWPRETERVEMTPKESGLALPSKDKGQNNHD
jgi:choline kinase